MSASSSRRFTRSKLGHGMILDVDDHDEAKAKEGKSQEDQKNKAPAYVMSLIELGRTA